MKLRIAVIACLTAACSDSEPEQVGSAAAISADAAPAPVVASSEQFRQLQWIAGRWVGSGGAYAAFYEEYRILDDSTMQMRAFGDATFAVATDSSWIELRGGAIRKRGDRRTSVAVELTPESVRFAEPGVNLGGFTFTRTSDDEWKAILHPSSAGGQQTVYTMRRADRKQETDG